MAIPVIMPKFEMSQETGLLVEWLKEEGEFVKKGEILFTVETDKLTMEVESPGEGYLAGVALQPGEESPVTSTIAYLIVEGEPVPAYQKLKVEKLIENAEVGERKEETRISPVAMRMIEENNLDVKNIAATGVNDTVTKEDVAAFLQKNTHAKEERIRATPAARRIARENNLDLIDAGSGPHGRVQERDMLSLVQDAPISERHLEDKTVPLKGMRKVIAEKMVQSYQNIPHIHLTVSVDMTNFSSLRATLNAKKQQPGDGKISVTSLMVFLISRVLEKHPWLNSSLVGEEIQFSAQVNIGVAVALSEGLIVPVIKTANRKDIYRIIQEMNELTSKARGNELKPEDVSNGTFTITNLGPYGIEQFTAIINPGQCAILAVGAAKEEIVPINGKPQVHTMMKMTMAADHRVVDGAIAALFLGELKTVLENPGYLLFK